MGKKARCPKCGYEPDEYEGLKIRGSATVYGVVCFTPEPDIDWEQIYSDEEEILCPRCGEWSSLTDWLEPGS